MCPTLCVLLATIALAAGHCQTLHAATTTVTFQSSTYSDVRQLLAREAATGAVMVKANLGFPEQASDRYPAVIVVHGIGGYRDNNEGYVAAELRKFGFATLIYDSSAARGTTGAALQGSPGYLMPGVADAFAALRLLSAEPRVDTDRISIIGFSYGAEVAHLAAFETLRSALNPGPDQFAAHVAFYPSGTFGAVAEPGAYTAWTVPDLTTARFFPDLVSLKKCPLFLIGPKGPALLIDAEAKPFDPAAVGACLAAAPGYSMGFDAAARTQSIADTVSFLQRNL